MITPKIKQMIEWNVFVFATINSDWSPNVTPVAYVKTFEDNQVLITDNFMWKTIDNIFNNNNISFAFRDKNMIGYKGTWNAEYFTEGKRMEEIHKVKENEWMPMKWAIIITVKDIYEIG